jgi:hypothetical protein
MRRRRFGIAAAVLAAALVSGGIFMHAADASNSRGGGHRAAEQYVGYWMGIDPLDGGDARRAITVDDDGSFALIGRDTVLVLCDDTDRALITADLVVDGRSLRSDDLVLECTNTGSTVHLVVRYDVIDRNIILETTTTPGGEPVDEIIFHRVSD